MVKARSPHYPAIGLGQAIEKIKMVYDKDVQNRVPREVVARHAGYNSLNGKALAMLSALGKYGLLDGRGDETYVSDLALEIIANATGSSERATAIAEAAFKPHLFAEIRDQFKSGKASDDAIRAYLLKKKFLPSAVHTVIRSYHETLELVSSEGGGYDSVEAEAPDEEMRLEQPSAKPQPQSFQLAMKGEREFLRNQLSPECEVRLLVSGPMTPKELRKLRHLIYINELWLELDEGEQDELAQKIQQDLDKASEPS